MNQRLVLPINDLLVTAGYKNPNYKKAWGWVHYGVDCISAAGTRTLYACGNGEVYDCGQDGAAQTGPASRLGNVAVVLYRDVLCNDGRMRDLACRCYHLEKLLVKTGQKVNRDTVLGRYGNTGANTSGAHLHIEFDSDILHPCNAAGVNAGGRVINKPADVQKYGLADTTINPAIIWYTDFNQSIAGRRYAGSLCYNPADTAVPPLPAQTPEAKPYFAVYEMVGRFETEPLAQACADKREKKTMVVRE